MLLCGAPVFFIDVVGGARTQRTCCRDISVNDHRRGHMPVYLRIFPVYHRGSVGIFAGCDRVSRYAAYAGGGELVRSEEHTSELQSLMRISYAVFCLKKKNKQEHKQIMYLS